MPFKVSEGTDLNLTFVLLQRPPRRHVSRGLGPGRGPQGHRPRPLLHAGVQLQHRAPRQRAAAHRAGRGRPRHRARRARAPQVHAAHLRRGKPVPGLCAGCDRYV